MPDVRREKPYIWVTWLSGLLAGSDACFYKSWFKAHYKWEKLKGDPEREGFLAKWTAKHDVMVNARAFKLREEGFQVYVEKEFKLEGATAIVTGKTDVVAVKQDRSWASVW